MAQFDLGILAAGPHAEHVRTLAERCVADPAILAAWVGGSLASGAGDDYSDIDFRIVVAPGQVQGWEILDAARFLPLPAAGGTLLRFGEHALLHHLVLTDGTILDFLVHDAGAQLHEEKIVILFCRDELLRGQLEVLESPLAALAKPIDAAAARQLFVDYWIITHKQAKALHRQYDLFAFTGLFFERSSLLRAWVIEQTGADIDARMTLHVIGAMQKALAGKLTPDQQRITGMPSATPAESAAAIEAIRDEMARVGRLLAARHEFAYPDELEAVVRSSWERNKDDLLRRDPA